MSRWTDSIVGDRMIVDKEFSDRVRQSEFSNQEWGLIMTAVEFEIEHAADPDRARIVADTEQLPAIMPELDAVDARMPGPGGDDSSGGALGEAAGIFDSLKGALNLGDDPNDEERLAAAERLTQAYADALQAHLEAEGKFEQIRIAYQE